jgi:uncharacterized protein YcaQ
VARRILERKFLPRMTLLAPFDKLISHRERTLELFGFDYRLEMYAPAACVRRLVRWVGAEEVEWQSR